MYRLRITPGSHVGSSCLILAFEELKTMEISVNSKASQVITPTRKSNRVMALVRIADKKSQSSYDWLRNYRNKSVRFIQQQSSV